MLEALKEIWSYRQLLYDLTARELKVRYRRSFLGFLWSLITPLYQIVIMTVVVKYIWGHTEPNYSVKFLCALVPWALFQTSVTGACPIILKYRQMVKRIWMPSQMLPLAAVGSNLIHFLLSMVILFAVFVAVPVAFHETFFFLIVLSAILVVMISGLAMLFAALHTAYQDTEYIITNLVQAFYFLTPVMYPASWVHNEQWRYLYLFNPMATICEGFRGVLMRHEVPLPGLLRPEQVVMPEHLLTTTIFALLCFGVGLWYFARQRWQFPEIV